MVWNERLQNTPKENVLEQISFASLLSSLSSYYPCVGTLVFHSKTMFSRVLSMF